MRPDGFSEKLRLVLKTLVLSRTGLASALNVDKSLVGRWAAGTVIPSEHNLALLTRFIAERIDGFTMLDWDKDLPGFRAALGVAAAASPASAAQTQWIPAALLEEAMRGGLRRGTSYEGFWRTTRFSNDLPGRCLRDITMIRCDDSGIIHFRAGVERVRFEGWALLLQHQLFSVGWELTGGSMIFGLYNGVARNRAEILDGISIGTLQDAGGSPTASACVLERIGELTGNADTDLVRFEAEVDALEPVAPDGEVPEAVRNHLARTTSPEVPGLLRMLFSTSMARGPLAEGNGTG
ncbi:MULTISPECIES: hypothetical protein [Hyphobacterium]|uniref:HTH cro/C1-type domain-containing protein n=1 Tax=Hyphobacterium vulgare TaxID=1736751 RepID=A0ABV6ZZY0_9PROT